MVGHLRVECGDFQDCIVLCREHGFGRIEVANLSMRGATRYFLGDLEGALEDCRVAREAAARVGHHRAELLACLWAPFFAKEAADYALIEETIQRAMELIERLGAKKFEVECLDLLASRHMTEGRCDLPGDDAGWTGLGRHVCRPRPREAVLATSRCRVHACAYQRAC